MTRLDISLNGEAIQTDAPTLQALLLARGYQLQGAFACAINNSFVPRPQWPERVLNNGDRIDIVTPITGG
ncbi:sulfur carrier protein ThiS [Polaromonas sp. JS666]|uniref:sulfur carrier protein ThiS n=1 Tax=Polaromonas sp. (strain JS666 / ATCC BAA-500) TaxID=296591 RepID=UPI0020C97D2A|nr:sulfur carrier protein ThiS [Polaromonas sp. JS666]